MIVHRRELYYIDFGDSEVVGSEYAKSERPGLIISNDIGNENDNNDVVMVALLSSSHLEHITCTQYLIPRNRLIAPYNKKSSKVMIEHIRSISKQRLREKIGELTEKDMEIINDKIMLTTGIFDFM